MSPIELVKQLREESGISVAECKKVLEEAGGNIGKARELLLQRGKQLAAKKEAREVGEGLVEAYVHPTGKTAAMIDVRCETDFVARSEDFKKLAHELALQAASMAPESVEELLSQPYIRDPGKTIKDLLADSIAKIGENIVVKKVVRFEI
ncbi:MAG: translation elongation factor Ts [Candidatus Wildermuthbacteria bacterium RIFCSPHIGHO2_02_FULL_47_12]|uniref:Elongation factor Ts n=1 Tax=Candidatus Wildermuthbacteria bacterium RIFCSPHIGHO2_02_FULL_47_12 TaxID=1802451 RepID=A0A1G2R4Q9_9BACT|nr:MAG: translation elongation factor Ts [Candidatus Wildermuthbacteria bacterium RIFCSPHIGHO2_02_FULL_47_12]